ncbi:MAG: hypothetical protein ACXWXO_20080 [Nocardioides sp.]
MRTRGFLAAIVLPLALGACGGDDSTDTADDPAPTTSAASSPSESPSDRPKSPQCVDLWIAGAQLPRVYDGCFEDTERVKPGGRYCEFGKPLVTYDDRFYAVRGGRIAEASKPFAQDADYQDVLAKCSG